uniref:Tail tape measure protein n=1 Tax=Siphoviridae sp. ct2773 TaxID=2826275 RepID=A0A8S5QSW5_9CAUD|nr:MAG TPA: tail tape measure protein [Siphoviridae sp. ct2773]
MASFGGAVKLTGESEYRAALRNISQNLKEVSSELKLVSSQYDKNDTSIEALTAKQTALTHRLEEQKLKLSVLREQYEKMGSEYQQNKEKHEQLIASYNKEKSELERIGRELGTSSTEYKQQAEVVAKLEEQVEKSTLANDQNERSMSRMRTQMNNAQTDINKTSNEIKDLESQMGKSSDSSENLGEAVEDAGDKARSAEGGFTVLKGALADLISDGIEKVADGLKDFADDSSTAFSRLQAQLGLSTDEMGKWKEAVEGVYKDNFGESLQDVGDRFAYIAQVTGETDPTNIAELAENAMTLEDTFGSDFNETIRGVSNLMQHFGIDSQTAFDLFAQGSQNGLDYTDELGDNIAEYGGNFAQAGYSAEEYFQLLENGAQGGAYNLDKVNDSINEAKNRLGDGTIASNLSIFSSGTQDVFNQWTQGNASMKDVINSIVQDISSCTDEQDALNMAATAFGTMGEDANLSVVESLTTLGDSYDDVNGKMDEMKQQRYDNVVSQLQELGRTLQTDVLAPILDEILPTAKDAVNFFIDNKDAIITGLAGIAAGITTIAVVQKIQGMVEAFKAWKLATDGMTISQRLLNAAQLSSPVGLVLGIIAGLIAALVVLWNTNDGFREAVVNAWQGIQDFVGNAIQAIGGFFSNLGTTISQLPQMFADWLNNVIATVTGWVSNMAAQAASAGSQFVGNVVSFVQNLPYNIGYLLGTVIGSVISWVGQMASNAASAGSQFVSNAINFIQNLPSRVASFLSNVISNVVGWASNMASNASRAGSQFLSNAINFVSQLPGRIASFLGNVISNLGSWAGQMASRGAEGARNMFNAVVNGLASLPSSVLSIGSDIVHGIWNGISGAAGWLADQVRSFASGILDGMKDALGIHSPSRLFRDQVGKYIAQGIGEGFTDEMGSVVGQMQDAMPDPSAFVSDQQIAYSGYSAAGTVANSSVVDAVIEALGRVHIVLDDEVAGKFVERTVTNAIYA